ncbi:carboxymuconolactone decarboxylase family protein [Halalkalicoccus sp. NIPERK01]|uniref:carboxymuconolactone decarboxylase family protein n=1 Tax=Halalkalicoccus sp. NIPERK01 TaxID=3053469 RepID=UPI00256EE748|nr:carboxymuconolactone decarboxylase family protein [Halalkalicoccus sp. NIPERK01]MDL5361125.1 carboxymuconolactone decarboxylase family protein [Halalkalicoccus sp. NIPERK01]
MARVPYVESEDVPERHRDLLVSSLQDRPLHVYRALGNNPAVLAGLRGFLGSLWSDSGLSDRRRELVILAVTNEIGNEYEWHQHVNIARGVGIDDDTIAAVSRGEFDAFDDEEATLLRYALAVVRGEVGDRDHDAITERYDESAVVGIAALAEGYAALGGIIDALGVELEEEFVGWEPDE